MSFFPSSFEAASQIPFDAHPIKFERANKLYQLASSILAEYNSINQDGTDSKTKEIFRQFFEGRYLNINHLERKALEIIKYYAWENPKDLEPLGFLIECQAGNCWQLETDEQRVERRSPSVTKFWEEIAKDVQSRRTPIIFYNKADVAFFHPKKEKSPISVVAIEEDMIVAIPVSKKASEIVDCTPITYEDSDSDDFSSELKPRKDLNLIITNIQRIIDRHLPRIENLKQNINVGHDKNEKAKKALAEIHGIFEDLSKEHFIYIENYLNQNKGYIELMKYAGIANK